ncbi:putative 6-phosphogluconolactonase [Choanephora cucurbitarum]|uniref:6-phosphogluconolactonase n=1 Tax=Choanephora cucurbitarum TaxID=101091 RepID=A0A1C7NFT1_9FUNG|nr:putative 6-phosphogluconolactonase [Choanephora cucurbitarum]
MPIVYPFANSDALSGGLNSFVEKASGEAIADHGYFSVAISGGSLPKILSKELAFNKNVDFSKWHVFWADERCVAHDSADSNYLEVKKSLFDHIPHIPQENIYPINEKYAIAKDAESAATDYEEQLKKFFKNELPQFDIILLGMGPDGHCCSLFPGHPLLDESKRWVAPIVDSPKPPPERITLTYPVVNNSKLVVFVTAGDGKKDMVQQIIEQPEKNLPCQRVKPTQGGKVYWFIDEAAASKLRKESCSEYKL